ncbi:hypothetical protein GCWU000341_00119 [Oribacterium sp. oral taxon 078 str. F0262]|nr:hypothetical protein GCWU000341_00119 [Oribacterium sp. oral taxon 078 str. F0262]
MRKQRHRETAIETGARKKARLKIRRVTCKKARFKMGRKAPPADNEAVGMKQGIRDQASDGQERDQEQP